MDDAAKRKARSVELKAKRERLKELRALKENKKINSPQKPSIQSQSSTSSTTSSTTNVNVDDLVSSLLNTPLPGSPSTPKIVLGVEKESSESVGDSVPMKRIETPPSEKKRYDFVELTSFHRPSVKKEMYDKEVQTNVSSFAVQVDIGDESLAKSLSPSTSRSNRPTSSSSSTSTSSGVSIGYDRSTSNGTNTSSVEVEDHDLSEITEPLSIDSDTANEIMSTDMFQSFMARSGRVVERALGYNTSFDIMIEYDKDEDIINETGDQISLAYTFTDDHWTADRTVTSISWSKHHKELVLCSYNSKKNTSNSNSSNSGSRISQNNPDGVVAVWSVNLLNRPEYVFTSQSAVMCAEFHKFDPHLIIGGTYSGQVVIWDIRAKSTGPVQRTSLSTSCHTHPIYSINMIGTQHAHSLVTVSNDGRLCIWNPTNLVEPTDSLMLSTSASRTDGRDINRDVAITCMDFAWNETNQLLVGSESGGMHLVSIHGSKNGVIESYETGHYGPITALDFHPGCNNTAMDMSTALSRLALTSSVDFTVNLWNTKLTTSPLHTFSTGSEYIYDVQWSPVHPAMFVTADGTGSVDLWNLNRDTEAPIIKTKASKKALNKVAWSNDGLRIASGDSNGSLYIHDVNQNIAVPHADETTLFEKKVQIMLEERSTPGYNPLLQ